VVEDADEVADLVTHLLRGEGFAVTAVADGYEAVEAVRTHNPDLVLLDLSLPGLDGVAVCQQIRSFSAAYVIMLTARDEEADKLVGLSIGADDYITKPFSPRELVARVRVLLRRPRAASDPWDEEPDASPRHRLGSLEIDREAHQVWRAGEEVELTPTEFALLEVLSASPGRTFTRAALFQSVWQGRWHGSAHVIDVHISNLRRKVETDPDNPALIKTVRGVGYRLDAPSG
jgi:DNA-binding response OmpR family regulator